MRDKKVLVRDVFGTHHKLLAMKMGITAALNIIYYKAKEQIYSGKPEL